MLRSLKEEYKCVTIPFWDWAQESKVCELINNGLADEHKDDAKLRTNKDVRCNEFSDTGFILKDFGGKGTRDEITEQASLMPLVEADPDAFPKVGHMATGQILRIVNV